MEKIQFTEDDTISTLIIKGIENPNILDVYSGEKMLVSILSDGTHKFHDESKIDEAARIFWASVSTYFTRMQDANYTLVRIDELADLKKDSLELQCLHEGGVDNWLGYSESLQRGGYFNDDD